jgi:hypothetical protein
MSIQQTDSITLEQIRSELLTMFEDNCLWRRQKAQQFPNDFERNHRAAGIFDALARSVDGVPRALLVEYDKILDDDEGQDIEDVLNRVIGFRVSPRDASDWILLLIEWKRCGTWRQYLKPNAAKVSEKPSHNQLKGQG